MLKRLHRHAITMRHYQGKQKEEFNLRTQVLCFHFYTSILTSTNHESMDEKKCILPNNNILLESSSNILNFLVFQVNLDNYGIPKLMIRAYTSLKTFCERKNM